MAQMMSADPNWLAGSHSRKQTAAAIWVGSMGLLVLGLQPILLGAMFTQGLVDFDGLALIATLEIIAIAIGSVLGGALGTKGGLRWKSITLLLVLAALNLAMAYADGLGSLIGLRMAAGLCEGGLVMIAIELIARARHAERLGGLFVTTQTLAQSALALALALWVVPRWGAAGGFAAMGVVCILSVAVALQLADGYADM
ncbi:MFS transporter, partial [Escherichia coli]|nr:MFS transporter [Escherichia coli]